MVAATAVEGFGREDRGTKACALFALIRLMKRSERSPRIEKRHSLIDRCGPHNGNFAQLRATCERLRKRVRTRQDGKSYPGLMLYYLPLITNVSTTLVAVTSSIRISITASGCPFEANTFLMMLIARFTLTGS
jgi:hypothetical protein